MSSTLVRDWFRQQLGAWDASLAVDDPLHAQFVETVNAAPDAVGMPPQFVSLMFAQPAINEAASIGSPGCKREIGRVDLVVGARAGMQSDRMATSIADSLGAWFRERAVRLSDTPVRDLRTLVPDPPATAEDGDGRYFFAFVGVDYRCDSYV